MGDDHLYDQVTHYVQTRSTALEHEVYTGSIKPSTTNSVASAVSSALVQVQEPVNDTAVKIPQVPTTDSANPTVSSTQVSMQMAAPANYEGRTIVYAEGILETPIEKIAFNQLLQVIVTPENSTYIPDFKRFDGDIPEPKIAFFKNNTKIKLGAGTSTSMSMTAINVVVENKTLRERIEKSATDSSSSGNPIGIQAQVKDLSIFLLLDDAFLENQFGLMKSSVIAETAHTFITAIKHLGLTPENIDEMLGTNTQTGTSSAASAIAVTQAIEYIGMDNLLFEKAYIHMVNILRKAFVPHDQLTKLQPSSEAIRRLFCTKKLYLLAMITFLNSCHEAVASDAGKLIGLTSENEQTTSSSNAVRNIEAVVDDAPNATLAPTSEISKEYLMSLINVENETDLLALTDALFNERVKKILSLKVRGKIRDFRVDLKRPIQKAKKREEAEARAKTRDQELDSFFKEAVITNVTTDSYGNIIWAEISCTDEQSALLMGNQKKPGDIK